MTLFKTTAELLTNTEATTPTFVDDGRLRAVGPWLGAVLPRVLDVEPSLRTTALAVIRLVLFVDWALQARVSGQDLAEPPQALAPIADMRYVTRVTFDKTQLTPSAGNVFCPMN